MRAERGHLNKNPGKSAHAFFDKKSFEIAVGAT
jgi:hypothetical protein